MAKKESLVSLVKQNIAKNVYPQESNQFVNAKFNPMQSTRFPQESSRFKPGEEPYEGTRRKVRVTGYNWTGKPMANGLMPKPGYVATSDRTIPLGSKVIIDGKEYEVGDRTAKWVHEEKGDTIDIYYDEPVNKTLKRGAPIKEAQIIIK